MYVEFPLVTRLMVRKALVEYGLQHKTNAEIEAAMDLVDQEEVFNSLKGRYTIEVWDKETPINGVPADEVIASFGIAEGHTAYIIRKEGQIVFFQTSNPFDGNTPITSENALEIASRHLDEYVAELAISNIVDRIIDNIDV